jgi:hypothetical protein
MCKDRIVLDNAREEGGAGAEPAGTALEIL